MPTDLLRIAPEVAAALASGQAGVALESTLITHGLSYPANVDAARRSEAAVRAQGAIPATVAVHDGAILVGLDDAQLQDLAQAVKPAKVARQNLSAQLLRLGWAGTTARTPVTVSCAGPKSILDVGRTLEVLETRGVPVVGFGTSDLPGFFSRESGHTVPVRVDSAEEAARLIRTHDRLGLGSGILVTVPLPEADAIPREEIEAAIEQAVRETDAAGIHGPASTPAVLARVAVLTEGRSVKANLALIEHDASVAAQIAMALAALG